jgi:hypothetical protein
MSDTIIINEITPAPDSVIIDTTVPVTEVIDINTISAVFSVNGRIGNVILDKNDVGLNNVDNTSDLNKPVSYPTQLYVEGNFLPLSGGTVAFLNIGVFGNNPYSLPSSDAIKYNSTLISNNNGVISWQSQPYTVDIYNNIVVANPNLGNNVTGYYNVVNGSGNIVIGSNNTASGYGNTVSGQYSTASGYYNVVTASNAGVLAGGGNTVTANNTFAIGSNLNATCSNTTYLNNVCSNGIISDLNGNSNEWNSTSNFFNSNSAAITNASSTISFVTQNSANIVSVYSDVNALSTNWNEVYTNVESNSAAYLYVSPLTALSNNGYDLILGSDGTVNIPADIDGNALIQTISNNLEINVNGTITNFNVDGDITQNGLTVLYDNVYASAGYVTIQQFAASNPQNVRKGYNITLINNRVYTFAGSDPTNPNHYLEINANPITPIYQEVNLNENQTLIDSFPLADFKTAKYTLQIETTFNNDIYYSELNVVASITTNTEVVSEYGQISTSNLILGYNAVVNVNDVSLYLVHNIDLDSSHQLIVKGSRTNHYKI